jgi:hypothetical protein
MHKLAVLGLLLELTSGVSLSASVLSERGT